MNPVRNHDHLNKTNMKMNDKKIYKITKIEHGFLVVTYF